MCFVASRPAAMMAGCIALLIAHGGTEAVAQDGLPAAEPLEGLAAQLDNVQDLRQAASLFSSGLVDLETIIISEGLRRSNGLETAYAHDAGALIGLTRGLQLCKDACATPVEECSDRADRQLNVLRGTGCELRLAQCEIRCVNEFVQAVARLDDQTAVTAARGSAEDRMAEQRNIASVVALLQDVYGVGAELRQAAIALQSVALEEGIRQTLADYEEYGVPYGATVVQTAADDLINCRDETVDQEGECIDEAGGTGPESLLRSFFVVTACATAAALREVGCGVDLVRRYTP